jgi:hyaluronoglucosaminidase
MLAPLGCRDFENWTPIYNNDVSHDSWHSKAYQARSIALVKERYPALNATQTRALAKKEFERAATDFFVQTLRVCREVRPNARWGFYGFPSAEYYPCTGSDCGYDDPRRGPALRALNDQLMPILEEVDVILPSVYEQQLLCRDAGSSSTCGAGTNVLYSTLMNERMINATVREAVRLQRMTSHRPPVLAYTWAYYNSGNESVLLRAADMSASIRLPYYAGAQGLVLWGDPSYHQTSLHDPGRVKRFGCAQDPRSLCCSVIASRLTA